MAISELKSSEVFFLAISNLSSAIPRALSYSFAILKMKSCFNFTDISNNLQFPVNGKHNNDVEH